MYTPMGIGTAVLEEVDASGVSSRDAGAAGPGPLALLVLAAWCGLISGLLEVASFAVRKRFFDLNHFAWTTVISSG